MYKSMLKDAYNYHKAHDKIHLLCDIKKCNAQIRSMYVRQIMERHPIAHLENTPDGIKMTITTNS